MFTLLQILPVSNVPRHPKTPHDSSNELSFFAAGLRLSEEAQFCRRVVNHRHVIITHEQPYGPRQEYKWVDEVEIQD